MKSLYDLAHYYALLRARAFEASAVGIEVHTPPASCVPAKYGRQTASSPCQVRLAPKRTSSSSSSSSTTKSGGSALASGLGEYLTPAWISYPSKRRALSSPAPASGKRAKRWFARTCAQCSTNVTSQWRTGPAGPSTYA